MNVEEVTNNDKENGVRGLTKTRPPYINPTTPNFPIEIELPFFSILGRLISMQ
jgi:hypothetical protein